MREVASYLSCPYGSGIGPTLDLLAYWHGGRPVGIDATVANCIDTRKTPREHLAASHKFEGGRG